MKTLVDCDHVFDVLTRGPFPNESEPVEPIEQHLVACNECRRLAEALRPATELIHEAMTYDERKSLPEFRDHDSMDRMQRTIVDAVFDLDIDRAERVERFCRKWLAPTFVFVPIAAMVLLMLFGAPVFSLWRNSAFSDSREFSNIGELVSNLSDECLMSTSWPSVNETKNNNTKISDCSRCHAMAKQRVTENESKIEGTNYHCCTVCHHARVDDNDSSKPNIYLASLTSSCIICHK